jgi:hypothetical protein
MRIPLEEEEIESRPSDWDTPSDDSIKLEKKEYNADNRYQPNTA